MFRISCKKFYYLQKVKHFKIKKKKKNRLSVLKSVYVILMNFTKIVDSYNRRYESIHKNKKKM